MSVYVIAEAGLTHDGSLGNALRMVEVFSEAGADAVKFQDHRGQDIPPGQEHPSPYVVDETRGAYYARTAFAQGAWAELIAVCGAAELDLIVSPFSPLAVKLLEDVGGAMRYKVASGEVTNIPLLEAIRDTGRPVLLSSGMTTRAEDRAALDLFGYDGPYTDNPRAAQMICTSRYPCPPEAVQLPSFAWGRDVQATWGLSDHSPPDSIAATLAAVTLGATVIERHVTLSTKMYGSDAHMSMEPEQFAHMVREIRALERMLASTMSKDELVQTPEIQKAREVFLAR